MSRKRDFDDEDEYERPSRENMMQRRLRKARGEDVDDDDDVGYNDYADDDRDYAPHGLSRPSRSYAPGYESGGGGLGCSPGLLATLLGGVAVVLLGFFFANRIAGSIGGFFGGGPPSLATLVITPTPEIRTGTAVIQRIQQLNRLETTSYTVERVIEVGQGSAIQLPLLGDLGSDRLLLIAHGNVIAGVDLSKLRPEDVTVSADGRSLSLRLPPVEIFRQSLDNSKTRVYSRDRGFFAPENTQLETQARQVADQEILRAACEDGILQRATDDSRRSLEQFLSLLDFDSVQVTTSTGTGCNIATPAPAPVPTP